MLPLALLRVCLPARRSEFDAFLECGILAHGFLRLRCGDCSHDKLVAFSCKRRGFCPSCGARRMAQTAAHLVDHVIPHVPVRQWVLSLPIPLRLLLAAQPKLVTPVLQVVHRVITRYLLGQASLKAEEADSGAVTLIRTGGCLQRPQRVGLVRIAVAVSHISLALLFDKHPPTGEQLLQPTRFRRPSPQGRGDQLRQSFSEPGFCGRLRGKTLILLLREVHFGAAVGLQRAAARPKNRVNR